MKETQKAKVNKILVLSDFSENARNAILYTLKAFPPGTFQYILLNSYDRIYTTDDVTFSLSERMYRESQDALEKEEKVICQLSGKNVMFDKVSFLGFLSEAVNHIAKEKQPDMVVMGTKGASGLPAILIGSRASSLIKAINLPLLIVPENAEFTGVKNIVLAADDQTIMRPHHLEPLSQISKIFGSKVNVINIGRDNNSSIHHDTDEGKMLKESLRDIEIEFHHINDKDAEHGIARFAHEKPCDMVVVVERTRSFIIDVFHKSVSKNLALHTDIPLLVLHD